jgi:hypothetical protein
MEEGDAMPDVTECQVVRRHFMLSHEEIAAALRKVYPQIPARAIFVMNEISAQFIWETQVDGVVKD